MYTCYLLASVSRLQSAAKLLERDLARGHRLQVTPLAQQPYIKLPFDSPVY